MMTSTTKNSALAPLLAQELNLSVTQVQSAMQLLHDGATVPFIARYRKEATAGLSDTQLRQLAERLHYLSDLHDRRAIVLTSLKEQNQLTEALEQAIFSVQTKTELEDIYLPFRPKRRTKALLAKEAGLEPLALLLWQDPTSNPKDSAAPFLQGSIDSIPAALEGARQILMERFAEEAPLLQEMRQYLWLHGVLTATGTKNKPKDKKKNAHKYADYLAYAEPIHKIPSHRALALFRGRREQVLQLALTLPNQDTYGETRLASYFNIADPSSQAHDFLRETIRLTYKTKLFPKLELELLNRLRELADEEAIRVFTGNLRDLLLAAPAGQKSTMGLDPGIRTGVKVAVVDATGQLLDYTAVFPFFPQNEGHHALVQLAKLIAKYHVTLISIGNGTGSRETERLVSDLMRTYPDLSVEKVLVSEAGASIYSASELAAQEFPDVDVSFRGAISIARRLQDPLAELVKIEPKSIGVGQYQHDVNQPRLARSLLGVVEDCVNAVGVDVNTASVALLTYVAGMNEAIANNVIQYRNEHGAFQNREHLKNVPRMGEKTFQQAAGFLRITTGDNPLDACAVHPESYPLVEKIITSNNTTLQQALGNHEFLQSLQVSDYVTDIYGPITVSDVLLELEKPGRDPRPTFKTAHFKEGIEFLEDLQVGMLLEGIVSNVTNFGAFVDIGVHQDGLVHISAMTERYLKDPRTLVKAGDVVKVKVVEIDKERRRIGLSMRLETDKAPSPKPTIKPTTNSPHAAKPEPLEKKQPIKKPTIKKQPLIFNTAMADALSKLKQGTKS